jgi:hypothetical protein
MTGKGPSGPFFVLTPQTCRLGYPGPLLSLELSGVPVWTANNDDILLKLEKQRANAAPPPPKSQEAPIYFQWIMSMSRHWFDLDGPGYCPVGSRLTLSNWLAYAG